MTPGGRPYCKDKTFHQVVEWGYTYPHPLCQMPILLFATRGSTMHGGWECYVCFHEPYSCSEL